VKRENQHSLIAELDVPPRSPHFKVAPTVTSPGALHRSISPTVRSPGALHRSISPTVSPFALRTASILRGVDSTRCQNSLSSSGRGLYKVSEQPHRGVDSTRCQNSLSSSGRGLYKVSEQPHRGVDSTRCQNSLIGGWTLQGVRTASSGGGLYKVSKAFHWDAASMLTPNASFGWWTVQDRHGKQLSVKKITAPLQFLTQSNWFTLAPTTVPCLKALNSIVLPIHPLNGTHTHNVSVSRPKHLPVFSPSSTKYLTSS
jgi:hypothetical protein